MHIDWQRMKKKRRKRHSSLPMGQRRQMALDLKNGMLFKQAAFKYNTTVGYAYKIFHEFLVWKMEWKMEDG